MVEWPYNDGTVALDITKGLGDLYRAEVRLLDSKGKNLTQQLLDLSLGSKDPFYNFFKGRKLWKDLKYDPILMARVIADAHLILERKLITSFSPNAALYLEGLAKEAARIAETKKHTYSGLPEDQRLKLACFLYRLQDERMITYNEWWGILFPATIEEMKASDPKALEAGKPVREEGLRKVLRCMLESPTLDLPFEGEVETLWQERRWDDYVEHAPLTHASFKGRDWSANVSIADPQLDNPRHIENLLLDTINYVRPDERSEDAYNLDLIFEHALRVLSRRKDLLEHDYFNDETNATERQVMIQKVLDDEPIW